MCCRINRVIFLGPANLTLYPWILWILHYVFLMIYGITVTTASKSKAWTLRYNRKTSGASRSSPFLCCKEKGSPQLAPGHSSEKPLKLTLGLLPKVARDGLLERGCRIVYVREILCLQVSPCLLIACYFLVVFSCLLFLANYAFSKRSNFSLPSHITPHTHHTHTQERSSCGWFAGAAQVHTAVPV